MLCRDRVELSQAPRMTYPVESFPPAAEMHQNYPENPIVGRFRIRLAEQDLAALVRLYGYGTFFLVRGIDGILSWTGLLDEAARCEQEEVYFDVVASADA